MSVVRLRLPLGFISLDRLSDPLAGKELRVAARRRRSYALRCVYVLVLMVFIASTLSIVALMSGGAISQFLLVAGCTRVSASYPVRL